MGEIASNRIMVTMAFAAVLSSFGGASAQATTYVFSTFTGDDAAGMKLSIYSSTDALRFTLLSATGFGGNTTYLRDPSIMKYTDGKYYLAYTDPTTASCCNPEDHFGIAVSNDLINWTDLTTVKAGVPGVSRVWAPEWFIEGNVVRVIANIDTGNQLPDFQPYIFTAEDSTLTTWSGPTVMGIGADYIDTFVAKLGSTYHAFVKNDVTRYLEHATAPSLTGPWTFVGKGDWAGWGAGLEGPTIVQLDDGTYRLFVDPQSGSTPCQFMTSSDLNRWSARASILGTAGGVVRHGTVIRDMAGHGSNGDFSSAGGAGGAIGNAGAAGSTGGGGMASPASHGGATGSGGGLADAGVAGAGEVGGSAGAAGSPNTTGSPGTGGSRDPGGATGSGSPTDAAGAPARGGAPSTGGAGSKGGTSTGVQTTATTGTGCSCRLGDSRPGVGAAGALLVGLGLGLRRRRDRPPSRGSCGGMHRTHGEGDQCRTVGLGVSRKPEHEDRARLPRICTVDARKPQGFGGGDA